MTAVIQACVTLACIAVLAAGMFASGWYASEQRFTRPVEVPLNCGGGSPSWPPTMPQ